MSAQLNKEGPYFGITVMRNGVLEGAKSNAPRDRVKRFITQTPGANLEQISKELRMTENMAGNAIERLSQAGEIYLSPQTGGWHAGERRKAPRGLINSIWHFADNHAHA